MDIIYLLPLTKAYAQKGMDILFLTLKPVTVLGA